MEKEDITKKKEVKVDPKSFKGSYYSQLVGITVTDADLTLEFVYINPRDASGEVVSRVTLPIKVAEELSSGIIETIKTHTGKKK